MTDNSPDKLVNEMMSDDTVDRYGLYPVDWIIFAYLLYIPLLTLLFARPLAEYSSIFTGNLLVGALVLGIVRFLPPGKTRPGDFLRVVYPAILFTYFYNQTGALMHLFHPEFLDPALAGWEKNALGLNITLYLDQNFLGLEMAIWVTEILSAAYFSYYLMFPALVIPLALSGKHKVLREILTCSVITFFVSYNLFWFFPIEGPRWHFMEVYSQAVEGPFFREMVNYIIAGGAVRGGCMPSTHTGVALVVLIYLYRHYRGWFWVGLPLTIGIGIGAVYGRFHYPTDIIVGALIASGCIALTMKYYPRWCNRRN